MILRPLEDRSFILHVVKPYSCSFFRESHACLFYFGKMSISFSLGVCSSIAFSSGNMRQFCSVVRFALWKLNILRFLYLLSLLASYSLGSLIGWILKNLTLEESCTSSFLAPPCSGSLMSSRSSNGWVLWQLFLLEDLHMLTIMIVHSSRGLTLYR